MKGILPIAAISLAGLLNDPVAAAEGQTKPLVLAENGKPLATIVVADEADLVASVGRGKDGKDRLQQTVMDWALFLQHELKRATGADFPVVKASEAPAEGTLILVGTSSLNAKHGLKVEGLAPEEVRIATCDRGVAILGERLPANQRGIFPSWESPMSNPKPGELDGRMADRGTPNAVVFFLEKFVGFRYYAVLPGDLGTVVPEMARLTVPVPTDFRSTPDFPYRDGHGFNDLDWLVPARRVAYKEGASLDLRMNHAAHLMPGDLPDRPDLFAKNKDGSVQVRKQGTPYCYASPEYLKLFLEHVEYFDQHGKGVFNQRHGGKPRKGERAIASPFAVHVGPHDATWDDWDPRSQPFIDRSRFNTRTHSDLLGQFLSKLGAEVKTRWAGRRVKFLAQNCYSEAPSERISLPKTVDVLWCSRQPASMYNQPAYRENLDNAVNDWFNALGRDRSRLAIWEYIHRPQCWTKIPVWAPRSQQRFLQNNKEKLSGMWFNFGSETPLSFPFLAVSADLLWDANLDLDAYYDEFCALMFGPAGDTMRQLFTLVIDRYENTVWTENLGHPVINDKAAYGMIFPADVVAKTKALLCRARDIAAKDGRDIHVARIDYMINAGGEFGFDAFFRASEAYHQPCRAADIVVPFVKEEDLSVDGQLDEAAWKTAPVARLFEGNDPKTLSPIRRWWETDVHLLATKEALYVAFDAKAEMPPLATASAGDTAGILRDDHVVVLVRGKTSGRTSLRDALLHDLTDAEADQELARINGDLYVAVNLAGKTDADGVQAAASEKDNLARVELRIPWTKFPGWQKGIPAEIALDFRRFTARRLKGIHEVPTPRWQAYATRPDRWVKVELR